MRRARDAKCHAPFTDNARCRFCHIALDTTSRVRYHQDMQSDGAQRAEPLEAMNAALSKALDASEARASELERKNHDLAAEHERLRKAYREVKAELELLRRRIFVANAERVDTSQLQLEFAQKLAELDLLSTPEATPPANTDAEPPSKPASEPDTKPKPKPAGRRDIKALPIPEERIVLTDPLLEGKAEVIGYEESAKLAWRRGGLVRVVIVRPKYKTELEDGAVLLDTAPLPREVFPRSLATVKFPRFGGQCHYAAFFSISSLRNFNSNSIGLA